MECAQNNTVDRNACAAAFLAMVLRSCGNRRPPNLARCLGIDRVSGLAMSAIETDQVQPAPSEKIS